MHLSRGLLPIAREALVLEAANSGTISSEFGDHGFREGFWNRELAKAPLQIDWAVTEIQ